MSQLTINKLSKLIKIKPEELIKRFKLAGIIKYSPEDSISDQEKTKLLEFLKASKHKPSFEESTYNIRAGAKKVSVEVRKLVIKESEDKTSAHDSIFNKEKLGAAQHEVEKLDHPTITPPDILQEELTTTHKQPKSEQKPINLKAEHKSNVTPTTEEETLEVFPGKKHQDKKSANKKLARKTRHYASSINLLEDEDEGYIMRSPRKLTKSEQKSKLSPKKILQVDNALTLSAIAQQLNIPLGTVVDSFQKLYGVQKKDIKTVLSVEDAILLAEVLGIGYIIKDQPSTIKHDYSRFSLCPADPIVTVVGHVDHGKTSLLDYIRNTKVAQSEKGGITQRIGAYFITIDNKNITFLDTPGHEAFTMMRERGVKNTDITVLVVAADDGVKPQTIESINQIKRYAIPVIIAITKIDKPTADANMVKRELMQHGLIVEDMGGDILCVEVSALTGQGVDELLAAILLQGEMLELKCYRQGPAEGFIVESRMDSKSGCNSTIIVRNGMLKVGDLLLFGTSYGKVRSIKNQLGETIKSVTPVMPVEITGIDATEQIGDLFTVVNDIQTAKTIIQSLIRAQTKLQEDKPLISVREMIENLDKEEEKHNLILKSDSVGSSLALKQLILNMKLPFHITQEGVGMINISDIERAYAAKATIVGFNISPNKEIKQQADLLGVKMICENIIYKLLDALNLEYSKPIAPEKSEEIIGKGEVIAVFGASEFKAIAGCKVLEGRIKINKTARILRNGRPVYSGQIKSLRHLRDNIVEARTGYECGIGISGYEPRIGDIIEIID